jgi:hypothetical protein
MLRISIGVHPFVRTPSECAPTVPGLAFRTAGQVAHDWGESAFAPLTYESLVTSVHSSVDDESEGEALLLTWFVAASSCGGWYHHPARLSGVQPWSPAQLVVCGLMSSAASNTRVFLSGGVLLLSTSLRCLYGPTYLATFVFLLGLGSFFKPLPQPPECLNAYGYGTTTPRS